RGRNLTDGQDDVRVDDILAICENQTRPRQIEGLVGVRTVHVTRNDRDALHVHLRGHGRIFLEYVIGEIFLFETRDEPRRDRVVGANDHVAGHIGWNAAGRTASDLRLQPWRVEEANEGKRQYDEQHHDTSNEHHDAEQPPDVALKGDVAQAQRAHHR